MPGFLPHVSQRYAIVLVCTLVLVAAAAIFRYSQVAARASPNEAGHAFGDVVDASADTPQSGIAILLELAREAMHDDRLVAPAGSNAFEFYLSVLQLEPENQAAHEALRESFPRASEKIEQSIDRRELAEARREIDLLREFDRNNFTLALLGGKLAAARHLVTKQHEAEAARMRQANAASM